MSALHSSTSIMQTKHIYGQLCKAWPSVSPATRCSTVRGMRLASSTWKHQSTTFRLSGAYRTIFTFSNLPCSEFRNAGPFLRFIDAKRSLGTRKRTRWISSASASLGEQSREGDKFRFQRLAWGLAKVAGASALILAAFIVALPSILSTKAGLRSTLAVVNRFVPGEIAITQVCREYLPHQRFPCMPTSTQSRTRNIPL